MKSLERSRRNERLVTLARTHTKKELAAELNMSPSRVMDILKSYGVKPKKEFKGLQTELAQAIVKELQAGTKQSVIADKFKASRQYVSQVKYKMEAFKDLL